MVQRNWACSGTEPGKCTLISGMLFDNQTFSKGQTIIVTVLSGGWIYSSPQRIWRKAVMGSVFQRCKKHYIFKYVFSFSPQGDLLVSSGGSVGRAASGGSSSTSSSFMVTSSKSTGSAASNGTGGISTTTVVATSGSSGEGFRAGGGSSGEGFRAASGGSSSTSSSFMVTSSRSGGSGASNGTGGISTTTVVASSAEGSATSGSSGEGFRAGGGSYGEGFSAAGGGSSGAGFRATGGGSSSMSSGFIVNGRDGKREGGQSTVSTGTKTSYSSGGSGEAKKGSSSAITYSPKEKRSVSIMAAALPDVFDG